MDVWMALSPAWWMVLCTKTSPFLQAYSGILWATVLLLPVWKLTGCGHAEPFAKQQQNRVCVCVCVRVLASFKVEFSSNAAASATAPSWDTKKSWKNLQIFTTWAAWTSPCMQPPAFLLLAPYVHAPTSLLRPGSSVMRFGTSPKAEVALRRPKSKKRKVRLPYQARNLQTTMLSYGNCCANYKTQATLCIILFPYVQYIYTYDVYIYIYTVYAFKYR